MSVSVMLSNASNMSELNSEMRDRRIKRKSELGNSMMMDDDLVGSIADVNISTNHNQSWLEKSILGVDTNLKTKNYGRHSPVKVEYVSEE